MVTFVVIWVRQFPLVQGQLLRSGLGHVVGSVIFAFGHFLLMVLARIALYPSMIGREYAWWGDPVGNLLFEYQKDVKIYFGMVAILTAYRYWRALEAARVGPAARRLIVQTGTGEHLIALDAIECLTAARNYVSVFTTDREYIVRETMASLEKRLPATRFVRCHRSHIVSLERIAAVQKTESGGLTLRLDSQRLVPVGRNYREHLQAQMDSAIG
jgi:hypothetical protein